MQANDINDFIKTLPKERNLTDATIRTTNLNQSTNILPTKPICGCHGKTIKFCVLQYTEFLYLYLIVTQIETVLRILLIRYWQFLEIDYTFKVFDFVNLNFTFTNFTYFVISRLTQFLLYFMSFNSQISPIIEILRLFNKQTSNWTKKFTNHWIFAYVPIYMVALQLCPTWYADNYIYAVTFYSF